MRIISRRQALLTLGSAAAGIAAASRTPNTDTSLVPERPIDVYAKIRASLRDERVPAWYRGHVFVALEGEIPRAVLGVEGFSFSRYTRRGDGAWDTKLVEVGYFSDVNSGTIVDQITNPLTGKMIKPQHFKSPVQTFVAQADGSVISPYALKPPSQFSGHIWPPFRQGSEIWVDEDTLAKLTGDQLPPGVRVESPNRVLTLGSMTTYRAAASDVGNPRLANAPCTFHLQELGTLPNWLEMGDVHGNEMWRLSGRKISSPAELPKPLLERIMRDHPTFLSKPEI